MGMGFFGLGLLIAGIALLATSMSTARKLDRARFEGTNSYGVEEFETYDGMVKVKAQRRRTGCALQAGGLLILAGGLLTVVGFVAGAESAREQSAQARQTAMREAVGECQAGDVDACIASDKIRGCIENDDRNLCIWTDNYIEDRAR